MYYVVIEYIEIVLYVNAITPNVLPLSEQTYPLEAQCLAHCKYQITGFTTQLFQRKGTGNLIP